MQYAAILTKVQDYEKEKIDLLIFVDDSKKETDE